MADDAGTSMIVNRFDYMLSQLDAAAPFAKVSYRGRVLDTARRLLSREGGVAYLDERAGQLDRAGLFTGTDWSNPASLLPGLVGNTLRYGEASTVALECLSLLRFLAIAEGRHHDPNLPAEEARHFLTQVLALNLERVLGSTSEAAREQLGPLAVAVDGLFRLLLERIGTDDILGTLVAEIWRILEQRPLQVMHVKNMIVQIAVTVGRNGAAAGEARLGADRLVSALFGPTHWTDDDPGIDVYLGRLERAEHHGLTREASGFARAMHDTGLVSDYHAAYLRWLCEHKHTSLVPQALGLSSTGVDALRCYEQLIISLIEEAVHIGTAQSVLGLALMLERGILYSPPVAPSLWRLMTMPIPAACQATLASAYGTALPARALVMAGALEILGQPLGVGQGNNPTCQSARALSMWALNDPDYLLYLLTQVVRTGRILMHFEGQPLDSALLAPGLTSQTPLDTDPVSLLLVPHLDRVYAEMGRRCVDRGEDPHRWINPELHGWWVGRSFHIAVDIGTGSLKDYDSFIRRFYAAYHPIFNGNQPLIHPQPAGIAVTDTQAKFVGWHAISIIRAALDQSGDMRVYFFNPNNDGGQDWGNGVVVSTSGNGEQFGESSLPFEEFASRLYIFHDDEQPSGDPALVPAETVRTIENLAVESWATDRVPLSAAANAG